MRKINTEKYSSFREFYLKFALLRIGFLWSSITGIIVAAFSWKDLADRFARKDIITEIAVFILIGGFLYAWGIGRSIWNNAQKQAGEKADQKDPDNNPGPA